MKTKSYEKIKQGMMLIKEGCSEITWWVDCQDCPFRELCDTIEETNTYVPEEWEIK